jgi:hypothetical protein
MAKDDASVVLYAVDLGELLVWVGSREPARLEAARKAIREDEDSDWEPQELELLDRLLHRLVFEGKLYEGLPEEERYYLTQLLIDLFDEFVDQEPLTEDMPLEPLREAVEKLRASADVQRLARWIVRGRELNGTEVLWKAGPASEVLSYLGYLTAEEAGRLAEGLDAVLRRPGPRPSGLLKQLKNAAEECAGAEMDLLAFVG